MFKQLGDRLQLNWKSRCTERKNCIGLVKNEHYAYLQVTGKQIAIRYPFVLSFGPVCYSNFFSSLNTKSIFVALAIIDEDFKATNKCQLAIATKTNPTEGILAWAMPKKSPYTKFFTKGLTISSLISIKNHFLILFSPCMADSWSCTKPDWSISG